MSPTPDTPPSSNPATQGPDGRTAPTEVAPDGLAGATSEERFAEAVEHRLAQQTSQDSTPEQDPPHLEEDDESLVQVDNPE